MIDKLENGNSVLYPDGNPSLLAEYKERREAMAAVQLFGPGLRTMKIPEKGLSKRKLKKIKKAMGDMGSNSVITIPYLEEPLIPIVAWDEYRLKDPLDHIKSNICGGCGSLLQNSGCHVYCMFCGVNIE